MKRGKKYIEASKLIERGNLYDKEEAIALVKKSATAKFDETIEVHIRTGCDGRHADQQIRGAVVLPHFPFPTRSTWDFPICMVRSRTFSFSSHHSRQVLNLYLL